jgi:flagellar FliL protein
MPSDADKPKKAKKAKKAKGPRSKRKLILVVGVIVLALGGGFFFTRGPSAPVADLTKEPGSVVALTPITLNLSDGRFLKAGLSLQLSKAADTAAASGSHASSSSSAAAGSTSGFDGAKALDAAISVLGARSYAQLLAPGGRAKAQLDLTKEVAHRYEGEVLKVYFTEFVMQ